MRQSISGLVESPQVAAFDLHVASAMTIKFASTNPDLRCKRAGTGSFKVLSSAAGPNGETCISFARGHAYLRRSVHHDAQPPAA